VLPDFQVAVRQAMKAMGLDTSALVEASAPSSEPEVQQNLSRQFGSLSPGLSSRDAMYHPRPCPPQIPPDPALPFRLFRFPRGSSRELAGIAAEPDAAFPHGANCLVPHTYAARLLAVLAVHARSEDNSDPGTCPGHADTFG
jgi:hypothetical protein